MLTTHMRKIAAWIQIAGYSAILLTASLHNHVQSHNPNCTESGVCGAHTQGLTESDSDCHLKASDADCPICHVLNTFHSSPADVEQVVLIPFSLDFPTVAVIQPDTICRENPRQRAPPVLL